MVSALISPGEYTGLSIGEPVIDRVRNVPFADGNEVCDAYGMTAQIVGRRRSSTSTDGRSRP
jgi:hypothetical protein